MSLTVASGAQCTPLPCQNITSPYVYVQHIGVHSGVVYSGDHILSHCNVLKSIGANVTSSPELL